MRRLSPGWLRHTLDCARSSFDEAFNPRNVRVIPTQVHLHSVVNIFFIFRFDSSHQRWTFRWKQNPLNFFCARALKDKRRPLELFKKSFFFVLTTETTKKSASNGKINKNEEKARNSVHNQWMTLFLVASQRKAAFEVTVCRREKTFVCADDQRTSINCGILISSSIAVQSTVFDWRFWDRLQRTAIARDWVAWADTKTLFSIRLKVFRASIDGKPVGRLGCAIYNADFLLPRLELVRERASVYWTRLGWIKSFHFPPGTP